MTPIPHWRSAPRLSHVSAVTAPIRILVVDDHPFLREGVNAVIATQPDMLLVGEAENGRDAIDLYRADRPDIVLMDLQMPGMSGIDAIAAIRREWPDARIIVLTTYAGDAQALRAINAGASGFLLKTSLRKELLNTIRSVHAGARHLDASIATGIAQHALDDALTERETRVLKLAAAGNSNRAIGVDLGLAEETVKGHMKAIFQKLSASDRTHAVVIAARRGFLEL